MSTEKRALWPLLGALAAGVVGVVEWCAGRDRAPPSAAPASESSAGARATPPCPAGHLLDDGVCLPLPPEEREPEGSARIELLPGRPPDYARYLTPLAGRPAAASKSGLGVFVAARQGTPAMAIALEAQVGPARLLRLGGPAPRLLTLHQVERGGATRTYVLLYAGLVVERSVEPGEIAVGTPLGRVAPSPAPTGLGIEVRQLRRGVELGPLDAEQALLDDNSLSCDARNVLPLQPAP
ncbi:MAG TPA: hypothetical protein VNN80_18995 [Polyangiaceae bacterium]|nr:hypothetical protein [Polyangiaceae bacterium]